MNIAIFQELYLESFDLSTSEKSNIMAAIRFLNDFREDTMTNYNLPFEALLHELEKALAYNRKFESSDLSPVSDNVQAGLKKMRELGIIKNGDLVVNKANIES